MFLYGSGIPNLARQIGMDNSEMGRCVAGFKANLPALDVLMQRVEAAASKYGYMLAVDGRWGRIRSSNGKLKLNTALNTLLQMTGSLVMKHAHVRAEDELVKIGYIEDVGQMPIVAHVHDEGQFEVEEAEVLRHVYTIHKEDWKAEEKKQYQDPQGRIWSAPVKSTEHGQNLEVIRYYHVVGDEYVKALQWAGQELGLRCNTDGEYQIGDSWADTH